MGTFCFPKNRIKTFKGHFVKKFGSQCPGANVIKGLCDQGMLWSRDITYKNRKHPGTVQTRDITYKGCSDQIKDLRDVVIKGRFKQSGT